MKRTNLIFVRTRVQPGGIPTATSRSSNCSKTWLQNPIVYTEASRPASGFGKVDGGALLAVIHQPNAPKKPEQEIREIHFNPGSTVVVKDSDNPGFFYLVRSGRLDVDSEHKFVEKYLSRFEVGDSFGLVSALTGHRFLVTIFAAVPSVVLRIPVSMLGAYLKRNKDLALKMLGLYCRELKALHHHLAKVNPPGQRDNKSEDFLEHAEIYAAWGKEAFAAYALRNLREHAKGDGRSELAARAEEKLGRLSVDYAGPVWNQAEQELASEEILFLENEVSSELYIVQSGAVKLFKIVRGKEFIIDILGAGELFGEMSFIDHTVRMASAVTDQPSRIMRVEPECLFDSVGETVLQKIVQSLARRIWMAHRRLNLLRMPDAIARLYTFLHHMSLDHLIKQGKNPNLHLHEEFTFHISFEELKTMCGIMNIADEKLKPFLGDSNLVFEPGRLTILDRQRLEERISFAAENHHGPDHMI